MDRVEVVGGSAQPEENGLQNPSSDVEHSSRVNFNLPDPEDSPAVQQTLSPEPSEGESRSRIGLCKCPACTKPVVLAGLRRCVDSLLCSFSFGLSAMICGVVVIAISTENEKKNQYFIIGPILLVLGVILTLRGFIHAYFKKEGRMEQGRGRSGEDYNRHALTRAQRLAQIEEAVISEENIMIPPNYSFAAASRPSGINRMLSTASQTDVMTNTTSLDKVISSQNAADKPRVTMVSIAVDTSDLPPDLESPSYQPPSYDTIQREDTDTRISALYPPEN